MAQALHLVFKKSISFRALKSILAHLVALYRLWWYDPGSQSRKSSEAAKNSLIKFQKRGKGHIFQIRSVGID